MYNINQGLSYSLTLVSNCLSQFETDFGDVFTNILNIEGPDQTPRITRGVRSWLTIFVPPWGRFSKMTSNVAHIGTVFGEAVRFSWLTKLSNNVVSLYANEITATSSSHPSPPCNGIYLNWFNSQLASSNFCNVWRLLMTFANSLDPDMAPQTVWHTRFCISKYFGWKHFFKVNEAEEKLSMQRV